MNKNLTSSNNTSSLLMETALLAGVILLENGGETFRAEETAVIICHSGGNTEAEVIALPTGIFITTGQDKNSKASSILRIKKRSVNLYKVERVNAYSRAFAKGELTLPELHEKLEALKNSVIYQKLFLAIAAGISSAMFSLLFEAAFNLTVLFDIAITFFCAFSAQYLCLSAKLKNAYLFTMTFISSVIIAISAILCCEIFKTGNLSCIIIGSITPLLPGISLTNAIRDTVMGDILSGTARIVETLLIAVAIAGGVGIVLAGYVNLIGGVI